MEKYQSKWEPDECDRIMKIYEHFEESGKSFTYGDVAAEIEDLGICTHVLSDGTKAARTREAIITRLCRLCARREKDQREDEQLKVDVNETDTLRQVITHELSNTEKLKVIIEALFSEWWYDNRGQATWPKYNFEKINNVVKTYFLGQVIKKRNEINNTVEED